MIICRAGIRISIASRVLQLHRQRSGIPFSHDTFHLPARGLWLVVIRQYHPSLARSLRRRGIRAGAKTGPIGGQKTD